MNFLSNVDNFVMGLFAKLSNYTGYILLIIGIVAFSKVFSFKVKK